MLLPISLIDIKELKKAKWEAYNIHENQYYFMMPYRDGTENHEEDDWSFYTRVSVNNKDEILGYYSAQIDRVNDKICNLAIIKFKDEKVATTDLIAFFNEIMKLPKIRKIEWCSAYRNPANNLYKKLIERYDGNIVGTKLNSAILRDGTLDHEILYEIFIPHLHKTIDPDRENYQYWGYGKW